MNSQIEVQKEKLKSIVLECCKISYKRNYNGLNVSKLPGESIMSRIKKSIKVLENLDHESETYKSLINLARKAANELNNEVYETWYLLLIESFITLPVEISHKKSKNVIFFPERKIEVKIEEIKNEFNAENKKQRILKENVTGNKLKKIVAEENDFNTELEEMSFEEDEFEDFYDEDDSTEDITNLTLD